MFFLAHLDKVSKTKKLVIRTECILLPGVDLSLRSGPRLPRHSPQADQQAPPSREEGEDQDSTPRTFPGCAFPLTNQGIIFVL